MKMNIKVEEYSPGLFDRLVSRGAKWSPSLSGPDKILVSEDLEEEEREKLIKHEYFHHKIRYLLIPYVVLIALSLQFFPSYALPITVVGLILWEGSAVAVERTALPTEKMRKEIRELRL